MPKSLPIQLQTPLAITVALLGFPLSAQTVYIDTGRDTLWSNENNWSKGVPNGASDVQIGVSPTHQFVTIDTGSPVTINSLTINAGLSPSFEITIAGVESLTINLSITNLSGSEVRFSTPVNAAGSTTWDGPITFSNIVNIDAHKITSTRGPVSFGGVNLNFEIIDTARYGGLIGSFDFRGATVNILPIGFDFVAGNTFDFTTTNFFGATLGLLPDLASGLVWDTSEFYTNGGLSVKDVTPIPEPSCGALITACLVLGLTTRRHRPNRSA